MTVPGSSLAAVKVAAAVPLCPAVHVSGVPAVRNPNKVCLTVGHSGRSAGCSGEKLPGVWRGVEAGGEGDRAEVQFLSEADLVSLAGEDLAVSKVEALNVSKYPCVVLETVGRGSEIFYNIGEN